MQLLQETVPLGSGSSPPEPIIQDLPIIIEDENLFLYHDDAHNHIFLLGTASWDIAFLAALAVLCPILCPWSLTVTLEFGHKE